MSNRCLSCGLVNFAGHTVCRRCNSSLDTHPAHQMHFTSEQAHQTTQLHYPLKLSFKFFALAPQISLTDAQGNLVFYVKQKMFKLKEEVTVFADETQMQPFYKINADRVIDFSAAYHFSDMNGYQFGAIKREGMRSLWKAHYDIYNGSTNPLLSVREENGWIKVLDALFGEIPIVGMFSGYVFNPTYLVTRPNGEPVVRLSKQPSFLQREFQIDQLVPLSEIEEVNLLLSLMMMTLLERSRG